MKIYEGIYQGKGIIQAFRETVEGEDIHIFIPNELKKDFEYYQKEKKLLIRNVEKMIPQKRVMGKTQFRINVSFLEKAGKDKVKLHKLEDTSISIFLALSTVERFMDKFTPQKCHTLKISINEESYE